MELSDVFLLTNEYMYSIKNEIINFFLVGLAFYYDIFNLYYNRDVKFIDGFNDEKVNVMKNNTIGDIIKKDGINLKQVAFWYTLYKIKHEIQSF